MKLRRHLFSLLLIALLCAASFIAGALSAVDDSDSATQVAAALAKTRLPDHFSAPFCLHGSSIGRDSFVQTVFTINSTQRDALMQTIAHTDGWTLAPVRAEDYRAFSQATWYPDVYQIPDSMEFDAWFYRITTPSVGGEAVMTGSLSAIGPIARGFDFAVFDRETGLFIFFDQFG